MLGLYQAVSREVGWEMDATLKTQPVYIQPFTTNIIKVEADNTQVVGLAATATGIV